MSSQRWLIDKSAYARLGRSPDGQVWAQRITHGTVHVSTLTLLEIGYSARSGDDWSASLQASPASLLPVACLTPTIERRAIEVQGILSRRGQHRAPSVPDLLIAATAELTGLVVLHLDKDFELIGALTGQEMERIRAD